MVVAAIVPAAVPLWSPTTADEGGGPPAEDDGPLLPPIVVLAGDVVPVAMIVVSFR